MLPYESLVIRERQIDHEIDNGKDDEIDGDYQEPLLPCLGGPVSYSCREAREEEQRGDKEAPNHVHDPKHIAASITAHRPFAGNGNFHRPLVLNGTRRCFLS